MPGSGATRARTQEAIIPNDELSLCIDIGKSGSRGRLAGRGADILAAFAGLEPETAARSGAGERLLDVVHGIWRAALQQADGDRITAASLRTIVVGSTSIPPRDEVALVLEGAARSWPYARVLLVEDGILGHAAALGGPGNYVSVGTGVVGYGLDMSGAWFRKDGWGPDLGDRGSAAWLGREGLAAALRAADRAGPATALQRAAGEHLGGLDHAAAARLAGRADRVAAVAAFARAVCAAADGDEVARTLVAAAAEQVAATARALVADTGIDAVAVGGRLAGEAAYSAALDVALATAGVRRLSVEVSPWEVAADVLFGPAYAAVAAGMSEGSAS